MGTEEPVVVRLDGSNSYKSGDTVHIAPMDDKIHRFDGAGKPIR
jgi:multiple sugar transport system ATP-binding protein